MDSNEETTPLTTAEKSVAILAGVLLVLTATFLALALGLNSGETPVYDRYVRPFTLVAAGLGTGHFVGRLLRDQDESRMYFVFGFFAVIFVESVVFTSLTRVNGVPLPVIAVLSASFSLVLQLSPVIPRDDAASLIARVVMEKGAASFLIYASFLKIIFQFSSDPGDAFTMIFGSTMFLALFAVFGYIAFDEFGLV